MDGEDNSTSVDQRIPEQVGGSLSKMANTDMTIKSIDRNGNVFLPKRAQLKDGWYQGLRKKLDGCGSEFTLLPSLMLCFRRN
jgi:hypothetical protein